MKAIRILAVLAVLGAMAGGTAYWMREDIVNWWLQRQLAARLSQITGAKVVTENVRYHDGLLVAGRCRVTGENMAFASLEIEDVRVPIAWERMKNPAGEPLRIEAASVDLVWRDAPPRGAAEGLAELAGESGTILPVLEMCAGSFSFRYEDSSGWRVENCAARGKLNTGVWSFSGSGGSIHAPGWPALTIGSLSGTHRASETTIKNFALEDSRGGSVEGSAKALSGRWSGEFRWKDAGMDLVLPPSVMNHFKGTGSGEARLANGVLTGHMELAGAEVRNLPALVKLASIFTGEDYSTVAWDTAEFDFMRDERGAVLIEKMTATSPKGLSVRGSGAFTEDQLSGDLELGLKREGRPWLVAFMPVLFRTEEEGYLWAPVKVGGTPQAPTEDLTPRVVAALAVAPAAQAVETAVEIPETAVEAAGGLLRSLFGR